MGGNRALIAKQLGLDIIQLTQLVQNSTPNRVTSEAVWRGIATVAQFRKRALCDRYILRDSGMPDITTLSPGVYFYQKAKAVPDDKVVEEKEPCDDEPPKRAQWSAVVVYGKAYQPQAQAVDLGGLALDTHFEQKMARYHRHLSQPCSRAVLPDAWIKKIMTQCQSPTEAITSAAAVPQQSHITEIPSRLAVMIEQLLGSAALYCERLTPQEMEQYRCAITALLWCGVAYVKQARVKGGRVAKPLTLSLIDPHPSLSWPIRTLLRLELFVKWVGGAFGIYAPFAFLFFGYITPPTLVLSFSMLAPFLALVAFSLIVSGCLQYMATYKGIYQKVMEARSISQAQGEANNTIVKDFGDDGPLWLLDYWQTLCQSEEYRTIIKKSGGLTRFDRQINDLISACRRSKMVLTNRHPYAQESSLIEAIATQEKIVFYCPTDTEDQTSCYIYDQAVAAAGHQVVITDQTEREALNQQLNTLWERQTVLEEELSQYEPWNVPLALREREAIIGYELDDLYFKYGRHQPFYYGREDEQQARLRFCYHLTSEQSLLTEERRAEEERKEREGASSKRVDFKEGVLSIIVLIGQLTPHFGLLVFLALNIMGGNPVSAAWLVLPWFKPVFFMIGMGIASLFLKLELWIREQFSYETIIEMKEKALNNVKSENIGLKNELKNERNELKNERKENIALKLQMLRLLKDYNLILKDYNLRILQLEQQQNNQISKPSSNANDGGQGTQQNQTDDKLLLAKMHAILMRQQQYHDSSSSSFASSSDDEMAVADQSYNNYR